MVKTSKTVAKPAAKVAVNHPLHLRTTQLFELSVVTESFSKIFEMLTTYDGKPLLVATPNPEQVVLSHENPEFQKNLQSMDLLLPDGIGLVLASQFFAAAGKAIPIASRVTGVDLVKALLINASEIGKKAVVIGGRGYEKISSLTMEFKDGGVFVLDIPATQGTAACYWLEGYVNAQHSTKAEEAQIERVLEKIKPEYVFVALGAPLQEQWLLAHEALLQKNRILVGMAVGGTFDILTGTLERAPGWMLKLHLEWLYRLWQEPWRWRRQLKLLKFVKLVVQELLQ